MIGCSSGTGVEIIDTEEPVNPPINDILGEIDTTVNVDTIGVDPLSDIDTASPS